MTKNPELLADVVGYLDTNAESFDQVAAIFKTIQDEAEKGSRVRALAGAGLHIAAEMRELGRCWRDDVRANGVEA